MRLHNLDNIHIRKIIKKLKLQNIKSQNKGRLCK